MYYSNSVKLLGATMLVWVLVVQQVNSCIEKERGALLELKKGLVDGFGILSSWADSHDCYSWWGISCKNQTCHVVELDLHARDYDKPLRGEISTSLVELQHLNSIDLSWNNFHVNHIPEFLCSLANLRFLYLSHASFGGKIPYQLGKLLSLQILYLNFNYLVGEIPWQLANLSNLIELHHLQENHLGGIIPHQLGNLSTIEVLFLGSNDNLQFDLDMSWISRLSSLSTLQLDDVSNLRKSIHWLHKVGLLPNLQSLLLKNCSLLNMDILFVHPSVLNFSYSLTLLDLSYNKFTSSIFPWLFHLNSTLASLDLEDNLLEGPIPNDLGRIMNSLQTLRIYHNQLSGTLPKTIANLLELESFYVSRNFFEGEITNMGPLANLTKLTFLSLSQNSFNMKFNDNLVPQFQLVSHSFPKWLQTQNDLYSLDVSNTRISDMAITTAFLCSAKRNLNHLNMSSKNMRGQLPNCWNDLASLKILDLSNNEFFGNVPTSMAALLLVHHLILRHNHFIGPIPSLKNCSQLVMLDVAHNKLVGPIPPRIGHNLHNLQFLSMRNNHLNGSLPLDLCHLTSIQVLDLSLNNLSRQIPKCLQNLSAMSRKPTPLDAIDIFYIFINGSPSFVCSYDFYPTVRWKGKELSFKNNLRLLKLIDMSDNELSEKIPVEIGNLSGLVSLDLSSNNLNGEIPWEFENLHTLKFLDLSTNHMSGTIPSSLSQLDWLSVLNLSHNDLSRKIPSGTQLQSFDASAYD